MKDVRLRIDTNTFIRFWLVVIGFVLALGALYVARNAAIMLLLAFFLALVLNRPVSFLARYLPGKSRVLGVLTSYTFILLVISFVFVTIVPRFLEQSAYFVNTIPNAIGSIEDKPNVVADFVERYGLEEHYETAMNNLKEEAGHFASQLGSAFFSLLSGIISGFAYMLLVMVLTFLMLTEGPAWGQKFWALVYRDPKRRSHHQKLAGKMYDVVSGYVNSQAIVAAIAGVMSGLGAFVLAMIFNFTPSIALPVASIVFVTAFIPMFGNLIGAIISAVLMLLYSPLAAVFYIIYCTLYQQVENNWVAPKIQAKRTQMSALLVIAAAAVGLHVGGIFGAFVAIPVAGCVMVLLRDYIHLREKKWNQTIAGAAQAPDCEPSVVLVDADTTINIQSDSTTEGSEESSRKKSHK